jgi:hypothetical protein
MAASYPAKATPETFLPTSCGRCHLLKPKMDNYIAMVFYGNIGFWGFLSFK